MTIRQKETIFPKSWATLCIKYTDHFAKNTGSLLTVNHEASRMLEYSYLPEDHHGKIGEY